MSSKNSVKNLEKELEYITARIGKLELEKQEIENKLKNKNKNKNKEKASKSTGKVITFQEQLKQTLQQRRKN